jgi:hypothetical protein
MACAISKSSVSPYFGNMVGAVAAITSIRPGTFVSPNGHNARSMFSVSMQAPFALKARTIHLLTFYLRGQSGAP